MIVSLSNKTVLISFAWFLCKLRHLPRSGWSLFRLKKPSCAAAATRHAIWHMANTHVP